VRREVTRRPPQGPVSSGGRFLRASCRFMSIERYASGTPWEPIVGYSRAVRAGQFVVVAGTTATGESGELVGADTAYEQTHQALRNVEKALGQAGMSLQDVIQTRIYVTDIEQWEEVGRAHGDVFADIRPTTAMVEVSRLIDSAMLVEVEALAYAPE
jgi:enamine deaminase RidA (YjgF/YER057c/UK114 family)